MPDARRATLPPIAGWEQQSRQTRAVLDRYGVPLALFEALTRPLPHGLAVDSALASADTTVFDAWFHWTD